VPVQVAMKVSSYLGGVILLICSQLGYALEFIVHAPDKDNPDRKILLIRDCKDSATYKCEEHETQFFSGDSVSLRKILKANSYAEIWLNSNGGNLMEGVEIGRILREKKQFVRVPNGGRCVSACTVAFLGGILRTVDPEARYEVHAYSTVLVQVPPEDILRMKVDPELTLESLAREHAKDGRKMAKILMIYFQEMLNGEPNKVAVDAATVGKLSKPIPYLRDGRLQQDVARFQAGQVLALQEIIMTMERESMALAIEDLKAVQDTLGKRASAAIRMLEIMFTSRIMGTALLNESTLREMGFVNVR